MKRPLRPREAPVERIEALADEIRALLAGKGPEMQGTVLAELVSTYILGFHSSGGPITIDEIREKMLELHIETVRLLIAINAEGHKHEPRPH